VLGAALAATAAGCGSSGAAHRPPPASVRAPSVSPPPAARPPAPPRRVRGPHDHPVPILMYHVVSAPPAGTPYPELWVPGRTFAMEMFALSQRGFHGITLDQVQRYWRDGIALPRKPIVISFDDGYFSQYSHAARTLKALHWPGVLNLEVHNLGIAGGLSERQIRSLITDGWEVDAHTITHPDLTTVDAARLRREVAGSRAIIRQRFGVPVNFFCYPAGRYNATVEAAVRAAGYLGATTVQPGLASPRGDRYALPRIRVNGSETPAQVLAAITSARPS
jgi:peptidoglycan/xylan/chitin deacetylase (PgdA/CDA1 family)